MMKNLRFSQLSLAKGEPDELVCNKMAFADCGSCHEEYECCAECIVCKVEYDANLDDDSINEWQLSNDSRRRKK